MWRRMGALLFGHKIRAFKFYLQIFLCVTVKKRNFANQNKLYLMKNRLILIAVSALVCVMALACRSNKADQETISDYITPLNTEFASICADTDLLESVAVSLNDVNLNVDVHLSDDGIAVSNLSEALVQYGVAMWLKQHTGQRLDNILNALGRMEGQMNLTLYDVDGTSRLYEISHSRLKQLVRLRYMELNFNEVRTNVVELMSSDCAAYREGANGCEDVSFRLNGGFAEYTFVFGRAADYREFTQANLAGKYVNVLKPQYEGYGTLRNFVEALLESLQIEGYRFVYTTEDSSNTIRAAIPWRLLV